MNKENMQIEEINQTQENIRINEFDIIKSIACLMVIILHISAGYLYMYDKLNNTYWEIGNLIDSFTRTCVPLFIMVTGSLLLQKNYSLSKAIKKALKTIIIIILISIFYMIWKRTFFHQNYTFLNMLKDLYKGRVYYHLWYLYILVGIYLVVPFISPFAKSITKSQYIYFLIIWYIFVGIIPFIEYEWKILYGINITFGIQVNYLMSYSGYLLIGYYLYKSYREKADHHILNFFIFFISSLGIFILTTLFTANMASFQDYFYRFISFITIIASIYLFKFLLYWSNYMNNSLKLFLKFVSKYSYGIYLIHPIFIDILKNNKLSGALYNNCNPAIIVLIYSIIVFVLSLLVVIIFKATKIKKLLYLD